LSVLVAAVAIASVGLGAQAPIPPSEHVTGIANLRLLVGDLERSRAFYRDTLGLQVEGNVAGIPGGAMAIELVAGTPAERMPRGLQDPGAVRLLLTVRDIEAALIQVRFSGATVVSDTDGAVPLVDEPGISRAVLIRDPDGYFVQLMQRAPQPPANGTAGNVIGLSAGLTVDDMDRTIHLFRDVLGFEMRRDPEDNDDARLAMMGVFTAFYRRVIATVPGTPFQMELIEIRFLLALTR
jgi:catechol 2,3-dioxygenase-like lactoylglutathione lyase family enzyme